MNKRLTLNRPVASAALLFFVIGTSACDWDRYDPRLAEGTAVDTSTCGRITILADDFEDGTIDFQWDDASHWEGDSTATEAGGELVLVVGPAADRYASYITHPYYDFRGGFVSVEVTSVPDTASAMTTQLVVRRSEGNRLILRQQGTSLQFVKQVGQEIVLGSITFNPTDHRFWRIRHEGEQVFWETSPDGVTWAVGAQHPASGVFDLEYVRVRLTLHAGAAVSGGETRVDNVQGGGLDASNWCPVSVLRDDFSDRPRNDLWLWSAGDGNVSVQRHEGELVITPSPVGDNSGYRSASSRFYDMIGGATSVEVLQTLNAPAASELRIDADGGMMRMRLLDETLECTYTADGETAEVADLPFSAGAHRWWRLREESDNAVWEVSADGQEWTQLGLVSPAPLDLSRVAASFAAGYVEPNGNPGQARFDNFNVPAL